MRYFQEGVLKTGLQATARPYPVELLEGNYYIAWMMTDNVAQCIQDDFHNVAKNISLEITSLASPEPGNTATARASSTGSTKPSSTTARKERTREEGTVMWANVRLRDIWDLQFSMLYTPHPTIPLTLDHNKGPKPRVRVGKTGSLTLGAAHSDAGYPFIHLSFESSETPESSLLPINIVAKKIDENYIGSQALSMNERLRLGFRMSEDGAFVPEDASETEVETKDDEEVDLGEDVGLRKGDTMTSLFHELCVGVGCVKNVAKRIKALREADNRRWIRSQKLMAEAMSSMNDNFVAVRQDDTEHEHTGGSQVSGQVTGGRSVGVLGTPECTPAQSPVENVEPSKTHVAGEDELKRTVDDTIKDLLDWRSGEKSRSAAPGSSNMSKRRRLEEEADDERS